MSPNMVKMARSERKAARVTWSRLAICWPVIGLFSFTICKIVS